MRIRLRCSGKTQSAGHLLRVQVGAQSQDAPAPALLPPTQESIDKTPCAGRHSRLWRAPRRRYAADRVRSGQSRNSFPRQGRAPACSVGSSVPSHAEEHVCASPRPRPSYCGEPWRPSPGIRRVLRQYPSFEQPCKLTSRAKPAIRKRQCITAIGASILKRAFIQPGSLRILPAASDAYNPRLSAPGMFKSGFFEF